jgi:hypothetical protein
MKNPFRKMPLSRETLRSSALVLWTLIALLPRPALSGRRMHNIYWNTTNPMFRIDTTDNVIDVNTGNLPLEYDQVC